MQVFKIPLDSKQQIFSFDLKDTTYKLRLIYNDIQNCWYFDLLKDDDTSITLYQPLITGVNILDQYQYLGLGGIFVVYTEGDADKIPAFDDLNNASALYFLTN